MGLFLVIWGGQLWCIYYFGNATPFWDSWGGGSALFNASVHGTITLRDVFASNNEHRPVITRLLMLNVFRLDRQWDTYLFAVVDAPIRAFPMVALAVLLGSQMSGLGRGLLAGFGAVISLIPFAWENTLFGGQDSLYFMLFFGVLVNWYCWRYEAMSSRWWIGAVMAFMSLFTMAGGVFAIAAVAAFMGLRLVIERGREWKKRITGIAILGAIIVLGIYLALHRTAIIIPGVIPAPPTGAAVSDKPASFRAFLWAMSGMLSWPCSSHWACLIIQAPLIVLALLCVFRRVPFTDIRWFVIIAGASFWINALAAAFRRTEGWSAIRYCDIWILLLLVLCSCIYFIRQGLEERFRRLVYPFMALWFFGCLWGVSDIAIHTLPGELSTRYFSMLEMESNVRQYLATGNPSSLQGKIPYPDPVVLQRILDSKTIRDLLPPNLVSANAPLIPLREKAGAEGFASGGCSPLTPALNKPTFGTYGKAKETSNNLTLIFNVPRGTDGVYLQVAGYPDPKGADLRIEEGHQTSYSILPAIAPGDNWQTVAVRLSHKTTSFKIHAKDRSDTGWIAFSMPTISNGHGPGLWARWLAANFLWILEIGVVAMVLGAVAGIRERDSPV